MKMVNTLHVWSGELLPLTCNTARDRATDGDWGGIFSSWPWKLKAEIMRIWNKLGVDEDLLSSSEGGGGSELCIINLRSFSTRRLFWVRMAFENLQ